ncbi:unnamed protein product [Caenorhabditis auriculariae]|uniref:DUF8206 domain-containing protein n=1 Tax=Caenorhabditis auriculariae TaxID=2777116 RepID=A0A8S1HZN2_9PELO|nr:unnamed protein product [Caenorhabditis auriculariae]
MQRQQPTPRFIRLATKRRTILENINKRPIDKAKKCEEMAVFIRSENEECQEEFERWKNEKEIRPSSSTSTFSSSRARPAARTSIGSSTTNFASMNFFANLAPALKMTLRGNSAIEILTNLEKTADEGDWATRDLYDAWMITVDPNYKSKWAPDFIKKSSNPEPLRLIFQKKLTNQEKSKEFERLLKGRPREEVKRYLEWKFENVKSEFPFMSTVNNETVKNIFKKIMLDGSLSEEEKIEKLENVMPDPSSRIVFNDWSTKIADEKEAWLKAQKPTFFDVFKKMSPMTNILILGESGIGKSTFLNALINYLHYDSLADAEKGGYQALIDSSITRVKEGTSTKIHIRATVANGSANSNENHATGESCTQEALDYLFEYSCADVKRQIRIIDTPGMVDTRGPEQDTMNVEKILEFLTGIDRLDAIMVLLRPNQARLTLKFKFCLDELLVHLHKDAAKNIFFCFTNARSSGFSPGETLPCLQTHLENGDRKMLFNLDNDQFFCFDNESFRYLGSLASGQNYNQKERDDFADSWEQSSEQAKQLFLRISKTQPHEVERTLALNNIRSEILLLTSPLADIAEREATQKSVIADKVKEVEEAEKNPNQSNMKLYVETTVLERVDLAQPQTVCMADCCVDGKRARPGDKTLTRVPKRICRPDCPAPGVAINVNFCAALQKCDIFNRNLTCMVCGCQWNTHMHVMHTYVEKTEKIVDKGVEEMLQREGNSKNAAQLFIKNLRDELVVFDEQRSEIMRVASGKVEEFVQDCIIPYNDSYGEYLDLEIKQENEKETDKKRPEYVKRVQQRKQQYNAQVDLIKKLDGKGRQSANKSMSEIRQEYGLQNPIVLSPTSAPTFRGGRIVVSRKPPIPPHPKRDVFGINP